MHLQKSDVLNEITRASSLLSTGVSFRKLIQILVEQSQDVAHADLATLYLFSASNEDESDRPQELLQIHKRGFYETPRLIEGDSELISFLLDCMEPAVLMKRGKTFLSQMLLHPDMKSGIAIPVRTASSFIGVLYLNSRSAGHFTNFRFQFLDAFTRMAGGMLHNARLYSELQEYVKKIEAMKRYQENIFSSMTNILVTTDQDGNIEYFNEQARKTLGIDEEHVGTPYKTLFKKSLSTQVLKAMERVSSSRKDIMGLEGIYTGSEKDIDFALNVSPLTTKRGKYEGLTFIFSDQSRERALKEEMQMAVEERRQIKDMFSRYLSQDVVQNLMDSPDLVKPGGGKKNATIFFADIRGYTSFSEGKDPEYIIEVLNEYFSEAVEVVIKYKGYIDKFIGDCIMAAWGVPLVTEEQDARSAVACALEIQDLVRSKDRNFFKGVAKNLKVGIGMHSGPLVAGNLGSNRRMDYSVIGDTVNIAARLEGVAKADDVIITKHTRDYLGDRFKLKELEAVSVKGKSKPIPIFKVQGIAS